jgi:hypothetical protein
LERIRILGSRNYKVEVIESKASLSSSFWSASLILSVVTLSLNKLGASGNFAGKLFESVQIKSREFVLIEKKLKLQIIHLSSQNLL